MNQIQRWLTSQPTMKGVTLSLYWAAQLSQQIRPSRSKSKPSSVVHISPRYFSDKSLIGGGERYVTALAEAMSHYVKTTMISFSSTRDSFKLGRLQVEVYPSIGEQSNPLSSSFFQELGKADVVHCHQYRKFVTNLAIPVGGALGKRIFVTDHGGVGSYVTDKIPLSNLVNGFLLVSEFSAKSLPSTKRMQVIYGGVGDQFIQEPTNTTRENKVLFVGRIMAHKGINYLIEAVDENVQLDIIGRVNNDKYFSFLKELAEGKRVNFVTDASDSEIIEAYRNAIVTILPSVYKDIYSIRHPAPELLGLVLLESMACGTPVICTQVGGMPEIVEDGITGFVVPPTDPAALKERINWLLDNPEKAAQMGKQARNRVLKEFTWDSVAKRCLEAYSQL